MMRTPEIWNDTDKLNSLALSKESEFEVAATLCIFQSPAKKSRQWANTKVLLSEMEYKCSVLQARIASQVSVWKKRIYFSSKETKDFSLLRHFETMVNTAENTRIRGQFFFSEVFFWSLSLKSSTNFGIISLIESKKK